MTMEASSTGRAPVRISKVAGRYLLFDIDDIMYLRRHHNICSVFVGTTPQNPQQNIFMGLPVELMPEEAQVLVDKKVAYIFDDAAFHPARLASLDESTRRAYLQSLKNEGRMAALAAEESKKQFMPKVKQGKKKNKAPKEYVLFSEDAIEQEKGSTEDKEEEDSSLFDSAPAPRTPKPEAAIPAAAEIEAFIVTPTTTSTMLLTPTAPHPPPSPPSESETPTLANLPPSSFAVGAVENLPPSYPLYAHLQDKGYYMMPGLRFGCDYNVYPGDPLRFHSHFQAAHVGWDEEISMLDVVTGGRLGTNVKKGYLLGGAVTPTTTTSSESSRTNDDDNADSGTSSTDAVTPALPVRTFCVEWAAM
ncbi:SEN34 subunit of tRNA-splicing endonuclease [Biscogniauxia marginata]|nr:SEN34 subunit of tRNA-splicing endonuclease [Biscogniauxia marginata]